MFALFILFFLGLLFIGAHTGISFLKSTGAVSRGLGRVLYGFALAMPLLMAGSMILGNSAWSEVNSLVYTVSSTWIVIISGLFFNTLIIWGIHGLLQYMGVSYQQVYAGYMVIVATVGFAGYGIVHASTLLTKYSMVEGAGFDTELSGKRIALVSDLHVGLVRKKNFVEKVTKQIMKEKPDMILIAGDLIDGPAFPYEEFLAPLGELSAPLGVYFTPGNHEGYNRENALFYAGLPKNITVVTDRLVPIPGTNHLLAGFDYKMEEVEAFRTKASGIMGSDVPTIAILHDPKHREVLGKAGVSLVVSGHTHGGQFFPHTLIVRMLYGEKISGLVGQENGSYYTTTGAGTAVSPARVGSDAEIVMLEVK